MARFVLYSAFLFAWCWSTLSVYGKVPTWVFAVLCLETLECFMRASAALFGKKFVKHLVDAD